jgi:hypothetical protein
MDVVVSEAEMDVWALTDLLGRPMGSITKASERRFVIEPPVVLLKRWRAWRAVTPVLMTRSQKSRHIHEASAGAGGRSPETPSEGYKPSPSPVARSSKPLPCPTIFLGRS